MPRARKQKNEDIDLEDIDDNEPPSIEPYSVLGLEKTATPDEIKSAYRKAALKNHPDKASPEQKDEATLKFQEIAFAYAILSDPIRKKRYDITGSTAESISIDDDFSWSSFYSEQFRDIITPGAIEAFSKAYKGSDEEKDDVINAYTKYKGKMKGIYEVVMLSNCLEDEDRFRAIIDEAIENKDVEPYKAYTGESAAAREKRMESARNEGKEAEEHAKSIGVYDKLFNKEKNGKKTSSEDSLAALIRSRQSNGMSFLDKLEAKYSAEQKPKKSNKKGKKEKVRDDDQVEEEPAEEEPTEEEFQAAAKRLEKNKKRGSAEAEAVVEGGRKSKRAKR